VIKVNLLATSPGAPPREWVPREQRSALAGLGMLVATAMVVGGWWYYLTTVRAGLDTRIASAETEMVRLKEAAKLVDTTQARKKELAERLDVMVRLQGAKRAPVRLLETLSQSLPDGLWLLEVKQAGRTVQIDGRALSITAITDFSESLQNSGLFERPVEIVTTSSDAVDETPVARFSVKADLAASVPTPSAKNPAGTGAIAGLPATRTGA
jgi:Tfp pilus assembly protein PilN